MSAFKTLSATDGFGRLTAQTKALAVLGEAFPKLSAAITFATANLSAFIAVAAGIVGIIALFDHFNESFKEAKEKAAASKAAYEETKTQLQQVNSELETTQSRMDELNAKGGLTLVEEAEMLKLQQANEHLLAQKKILEDMANRQQKQAAKDASNVLNKSVSWETTEVDEIAAMNGAYAMKRQTGSIIDRLAYEKETVLSLNEEYQSLQKQYDDLSVSHAKDPETHRKWYQNDFTEWEKDEQRLQTYSNRMQEIDGQIQTLEGRILDHTEEVKEQYDSLFDENGQVISGYEELVGKAENALLGYTEAQQAAKKRQEELNSTLSDDTSTVGQTKSLKEQRDELLNLAKANKYVGITADDVTNSYSDLVDAAAAAGFTVEDIVNTINSEAGVKSIANMKAQLRDMFSKDDFNISLRAGEKATQEFDDIISKLSDEEIEIFYKYVNDNELDLSEMSIEDLQANIDIAVNGTSDVEEAQSNIDKLSESVSKYAENLSNVQSILNSQSTGKSISLDDYNSESLKDYQSALEYVNGTMQLNAEKVREIAMAKAEEEKANIATNKAIEQSQYLKNAGEIEKYREQLRTATDLTDAQRTAINDSISALLAENATIANTCSQYDIMAASINEATSAYQHWLNAQNASQTGDMFDSSLGAINKIKDTLTNSESSDYQRIGNEDYKAAISFIIPDTIDSEDQSAVTSYLDSLNRYITTNSEGKLSNVNAVNFYEDAAEKGLMVFDEASQEYTIAGQKTMQDFADGLNLSLPMVQAIFGELQEFGIEFDWSDEGIKTLGDLGVAANESAEALRSLKGNENLKIVMDVSDFNDAELKCKTLDDTIKEMQNLKDPEINPSVDTSQIEHANAVIEYCIAQKQLFTQPAVMTVDSSQVTGELGEALSLLQQFQQAQNQLEVQTEIGADTSEAEAQVTALTGQIEALSPSIKTQIGLDDTSTEGITEYIEGLDAEAIVNFGVDSSLVDAYQSAEHKAKGTTEWDNDTSKVDAWASQNHQSDGTVRWYNDISLVKTQFTATGTINWTNTTPPTGGTHSLNGTAHSSGTAHANGNWGTAKGGKALMGELGTEIIVDPRTGMWYTVGDNGAEFVNVPQNAIIFNHMQSESLLKYGYVSGRGTAYASGTALLSGGNASLDRLHQITPGSSGGNSGSSSGYTGSSSVGTSSTSSSSSKGSDSTSKTSKKVKDLFDFIEIRISRLQRKIEKFKDNVENTFKSFSKRNESLDKEIKSITTAISAQEKAYNRYMKEADKIDLSNSLKKKIRNGDIKLASYSDDKQELIKKYQELYEKALDAKDGIDELKQSLVEASKVRFDLIVEKWDVKLQSLEHTAERLTSLIERRNAYASDHVSIDTSTKTAQDNIGTYRELVSTAQKEISKKQKEHAELIAQLNKDLNDPNSGLKEGTTEFKERMEEIYKVENEIDALSADIIDYSNQISEAYMTMFNNLATQYSNEMDLVAHLANEYSLALQKAEAKGLIATESYYENMRQVEQNNLSLLNEELKALQEQKRKALESGEIELGSADYYEMTKQINDISEAIMEAELNIIEFNNSIREVKWKQFDYARDSVSNLNDEISFLVDLLGDEKLIDDKGKFTDEGLATLGLYGTSYNVLMAEADKYAEEIKRINEEIANDPANTKLLERQQELLKSQQSLILSANDQKQAIVDLVESGINKELSSMKELIQSYTDALDRQKDLYDFQKKVKEQAKNIAELEKQLSAYQNDISEETKSKVQKLKVELESAKEDLEETQYEYMISEQKKMLDELYNDLEKTLNSRLDDVDALVEEMIATANKNAVTINETLQSATKDVGYTMTEEMDSIWSQAAASNGEIQSAITMYGEQFSTKQTATNEALGSIEKKIDAMIAEAKRQADEAAAQIEADKKKQEQADKEAAAKGEGNGTKQDAQNAVKPSTGVKTENELVLGSDKVKIPKPKPLGDSNTSSKQGDGKVQVGDKVKYASGSYHAASDGSGASGSMYKGKQVYITKIKSGSKYPYHISTGKKLGSGDLGWLKKSQISGYASGLRKAVKEEDAWVDELGTEILMRPTENAMLTHVQPGDSILTPEAIDNIWQMANDPSQYLRNLSIPERQQGCNGNLSVTNSFDNITFTLPNVKNYEEFLYAMQHDKRAEQLIQSMTIDSLVGIKNGKQRFNF